MKRRSGGFSLIEVLLASTLFAILAVLSFVLLRRGSTLWRDLVESESANLQLAKAASRLRAEVVTTGIRHCAVGTVPASLAGAAKDGSALWFLSALDPATGEMVLKPDGTPFWQRNIVYYLVVPNYHQSLFGSDCAGGLGPNGCDDRCPHKVLIRKVVDSGVATSPTGDPNTVEEKLLSDVTPYLTRPSGYDMALMGAEAGVERAELIATQLLWFEVKLGSAGLPAEVNIDLRAVATKEAQSKIALGSAPLSTGPYTTNRLLSIVPMN